MIAQVATINTFHHPSVDKYRNSPHLTKVLAGVRQQIEDICKIDRKSELNKVLSRLLNNSVHGNILRKFFSKHSNIWFDLMRKMYKYRQFSEGEWSLSNEGCRKISELMLVRGRERHIGESLSRAFNEYLLYNQDIIEYSSKQPSLLDSSGWSFSRLGQKERKKKLEELITIGLTNNINACTSGDRELYIPRVYPKIIKYLKEIFGKDFQGVIGLKDTYTSIHTLANDLDKLIQGGKYEDAWMIVQAFHAWSNVEEIEENYNYLKQSGGKLKNKLLDAGIDIEDFEECNSSTGSPGFRGSFTFEGEKFEVQWRIKTPQSILQKMWHKQDYNNADALRDAVGMYIIYPDSLTEEKKLDILKRITEIMPNYGYIIKNKGGIDSKLLSSKYREDFFGLKKPIGVSEEKGIATSDDMKNFSVSGFICLRKQEKPSGFEVQFLSKSAHDSKKDEDIFYKVKTAIEAFMRGPKYRLPSEIYNLVAERCKGKDASRTIWGLIEDGFLTAHTMSGRDELIFSTKKYTQAFERSIFPEMKRIFPKMDFGYLYQQLHDYVINPSKISKDAPFSINETSLQPPHLDR